MPQQSFLDTFLSYAIPIGVVFIFGALLASAMPKVTHKIREWAMILGGWIKDSLRNQSSAEYTKVITYE